MVWGVGTSDAADDATGRRCCDGALNSMFLAHILGPNWDLLGPAETRNQRNQKELEEQNLHSGQHGGIQTKHGWLPGCWLPGNLGKLSTVRLHRSTFLRYYQQPKPNTATSIPFVTSEFEDAKVQILQLSLAC